MACTCYMHPCSQSTMDLAQVTCSGSLLSIKFLFLRLAEGSMSAADTGGLLAICPATGASEGGRTPPEEKTAVGLAKATLCFSGSGYSSFRSGGDRAFTKFWCAGNLHAMTKQLCGLKYCHTTFCSSNAIVIIAQLLLCRSVPAQ